mmetsp:Transcript_43335/g.135738  ORF Transcript_43335/g.135738 Transcript_43335/m.135738 type:complete len:316 (+) Transcript_43335:1146-2093(+)
MQRVICSTASSPVTALVAPPSPSSEPSGRVVGKVKSKVTASSVAMISTMSRWSMQKSSTCSRAKSRTAPPSCIVRAPTSTLAMPCTSSALRPPGTCSRRCPRWDSCSQRRKFTLRPLPKTRISTPSHSSSSTPAGSTAALDCGGFAAARPARSSLVMSVSGTTTSSCSSTCSDAASRMTRTMSSLDGMTTPGAISTPTLPSVDGTHATMDAGSGGAGAPGPGAQSPRKCSQISFATSLMSASVMERTAASVARWLCSGSMKVWPQAMVSMRNCSWSALLMRSPWARICAESAIMALRYRSSSPCVSPNNAKRRIS